MGNLRKSVTDHKLEGSFRKCRHGSRPDVPDVGGRPVPPANLTQDERTYWDKVVPLTIELGTSTKADSEALGEMCRWWVKTQLLHKRGVVEYKTVQMAAMCFKKWHELASGYGLTGPAARAKLALADPDDEDDKAEAFLNYFRDPDRPTPTKYVWEPPADDTDDEPATDLLTG